MEHRSVEAQLAGLQEAVAVFSASARAAGLEADVPTCPSWTVRKLLAHQGMVHRWAAANLRGEQPHPPDWNAEGQRVVDPVAWLQEGADDLVATIRSAPDDAAAMVFLKDAPPPRQFWARRQCHETTIHSVDALAASLGRFPRPQDSTITDAVALDGIDEVLMGFIPRGKSRFRDVDPVRLTVWPTDEDRGWSVLIRDGAATTTRVGSGGGGATTGGDLAEATLRGSPVGLYLALWNRTTDDAVSDPTGFLATTWRDRVRVRWS